MVKAEFKQALKAAEDDLESCLREQQTLEKRILKLRQLITSLSNAMYGGEARPQIKRRGPRLVDSIREGSLMDEIRAIFRAKAEQVLNAQDVVEELAKLGHDMDKYQNQLATVGVMLGRLREKEEIENATESTGKRGFMARLPKFYGR